jgi:hypothetical protein
MASRLFALDGAEVVEVDAEAGGSRTVWVRPTGPRAQACPDCGTVSAHVKGYVTTRPADLGCGQGQAGVVQVKRRLACREPSCPRKTRLGPRFGLDRFSSVLTCGFSVRDR